MDDAGFSIATLHVYPVKSCAGMAVDEALLVETGLEFDRAWMVVDAEGDFVSQRELPRMALVRCGLQTGALVLSAPGMPDLRVAFDASGEGAAVRVWNDAVAAVDMGDAAGHWFSHFLRQPLRLVRFDPGQRRLADRAWTGALEARTAFADGFPLLVVSRASLDALNERLAAKGEPGVTMARFRPNLVLDGLDAHGEDFLDELEIDTDRGPVRLRLVKPCPRCPIPNVDPDTGLTGTEPGDTLAAYRADARVGGAISFGMNAVVVEGRGRSLRTGSTGRARVKF